MSETVERNSGPSLREQLLKVSQEMSQTLIDCEQVAQNYLNSIAGVMRRLGVSSQDVALGRFDKTVMCRRPSSTRIVSVAIIPMKVKEVIVTSMKLLLMKICARLLRKAQVLIRAIY